jgi:AsmA protein
MLRRLPGRRVLLILGIPVGLLAGAALGLPYVIDVNRHRPLMTRKILNATGRTVHLGSISFRLLPSPGLSVRPLRLGDSARYAGRDALRAEALTLRVSLLPLLRGRVVVRSVVLEKPTVSLIRDAAGRWNFDDLVARLTAPPAGGGPPAEPGFRVAVEEALIRSGTLLIYDDAVVPRERSELRLQPIDASIRGWGGDDETTLVLRLGVGGSRLQASARLHAAGDRPILRLRADSRGLQAGDLLRLAPWAGLGSPAGIELAGEVDLQGEADVPLQKPETLVFKGTAHLSGVRYRDATMGGPIEGISGLLAIDGRHAVWDEFTARAGGSSLAGKLQIEDFQRPRIGFAFTSPRLDLDALIAILAPAAPAPVGTAARQATPVNPSADGLLRKVSGRGTLEVEALRFQSFDLDRVNAAATLAEGVLSLKEMKAGFYGGTLAGSAQASLLKAPPAYGAGVRLSRVDVEPLIAAYDPALKGLLRGRLSGSLDLTAAGSDLDALLDTASGGGSLELVEGGLTSFSVLKQLAALLEMAGGRGIGREETPFEFLRGTLQVGARRARTADLLLHAPDLDLEAKGWVGLDATLELDAAARFSEEATRGMVEKNGSLANLTDRGRLVVHFNLSGALAAPRFKLDTRASIRETGKAAKERARERLRERLQDRILKQIGSPEEPAEETPEAPPE